MAVAKSLSVTKIVSEFQGSVPTREAIVALSLPEAFEERALKLPSRHRNGELTLKNAQSWMSLRGWGIS
jgi:hypothetical protein